MSRCVTVECAIRSLMLLLEGIQELGMAKEELRQIEDCENKLQRVDFVFRNQEGDQIGVRKNAQGQMEFVAKDIEKESVAKTLAQVRQTYARLSVINELKRKGYSQVKEEKLPNGSIRLVVQKWQ